MLSKTNPKLLRESETSRLLLVNLDHVILLHLQSFGGFIIVDPTSVKQKPNREQLFLLLTPSQPTLPERGDGDADPLSIGLLQFSHLSGLLDSEVNLIAVLANNLQLDVLGVFSHVDDWSGSWQYQSSKDGDLF